MRSYILLFFFIVCGSAYADLKLFDLVKNSKTKYSINSTCKSFFNNNSNRTKLHSAKIVQKIQNLSDFKEIDNNFFHYTNSAIPRNLLLPDIENRAEAQSKILKSGGYKSIFEFQMTYNGALSNAAGVGFYIAANPFSSADYGNYQLHFRLKNTTKVYNYNDSNRKIIFDTFLGKVSADNYDLRNCNYKLIFSLILDENNIDLLYYSGGSTQWFVAFNEDIFEESNVTYIGSSSQSTVFNKMAQAGNVEPLLGYIREINKDPSYQFNLNSLVANIVVKTDIKDRNLISVLLPTVPYRENKTLYISLLKVSTGNDFDDNLVHLKKKDSALNSLILQQDLNKASTDFMKYYSSLLSKGYVAAKKDILKTNMEILYKSSLIDDDTFMKVVKNQLDLKDYFVSYSAKSSQVGSAIIREMITMHSSYFKKLGVEDQYDIFNYYINNEGNQGALKLFLDKLSVLKFDLNKSLRYILDYTRKFKLYDNLSYFVSYMVGRNHKLMSDLSDIRKIMEIQFKASTFDYTVFKILMNNQKAFKDGYALYVNQFFKINNPDHLKYLNSSEIVSKLSPEQKEIFYINIINFVGTDSDQYESFLSFSRLSIEDEFEFIQRNSDISSKARLHLIEKFQSNLITKNKMDSLVNSKTGLFFFKGKGSSLEVNDKLIELYASEIIKMGKEIQEKTNEKTYLRIIHADIVSRFFDILTDEEKIYFLGQNERNYKDRGQTLSIFNAIKLNEKNVESLINLITREMKAKRFTNYSSVLLTKPEFLQIASLESFIKFIESIINNDTEHGGELYLKVALSNVKIGFNKATNFIKLAGNSLPKLTLKVVSNQLDFSSLNANQKKEISSMYTKFYSDPNYSVFRDSFWSTYVNHIDYSLSEISKKIKIINLTDQHKIDFLNNQLKTNDSYKELITALQIEKPENIPYEMILKTNSEDIITKLISFIEQDYPAVHDHVISYIDYYINNNRPVFMREHLQNILCKKVSKYTGINEWVKAVSGTEQKGRKRLKKELCR